MSAIVLTPSGNDDTAAIQQELDRLSEWDDVTGCLQLEGAFKSTLPIQSGLIGRDRTPRITSVGGAAINFVGPRINDYVLRIVGGSESPTPKVENVSIRGNYRCRGLLLSGQTYCAVARNVLIWHPRQVGMDVIDCWGSSLGGIYVDFVYPGTAYRFYRFNGATATQLRARGVAVTRPNGDYSSAIDYGMSHGGLAAADSHFGDTIYDWTAPDDTACIDHAGNPWTPGTASRSAVFIRNSTGARFDTVVCEGCYYVDTPIVRVISDGVQLNNVYFESCKTLRPLVDIVGDYNSASDVYAHPRVPTPLGIVKQTGTGNTIQNAHQKAAPTPIPN